MKCHMINAHVRIIYGKCDSGFSWGEAVIGRWESKDVVSLLPVSQLFQSSGRMIISRLGA